MKIGIFQEPAGTLGGSELVTAVMADALRLEHEVEIVHHRPDLTVERLEEYFELDLTGVRTRFVPPPACDPLHSGRLFPSRRYWREWDAEVSRPYDLFVANVHGVPPYCHAARGVLHVLFPAFARPRMWPWVSTSAPWLTRLIDRHRRPIYEDGWRQRMETYQTRLAISGYAAKWTEEYWGVRPEVLYPPVLAEPADEPKADAIVSVGRFTPEKQQADLLRTFLDRIAPHAPGWEMVFVGGLSDRPEDQTYFAELQRAATGPVRFLPNANRPQLRAELGRAKVYWHAMGLGVDVNLEPHKIEHFGIAPVEAMAVGCVPVVLACGGPAEVVLDGRCGFTCTGLDHMAESIVRLIKDAPLRHRLAAAARDRARAFSADRFKDQFLRLLRLPARTLVRT
jgi:L-malate glycosyltransferase